MKQRAKKSYGQHFLIDEVATESIANALSLLDEYPRVLEIGPGKGQLTKYLIDKDVELKAVEADRDMIHHLMRNYPDFAHDLILDDCLKVNFFELYGGNEFVVIGNFPYNISSQIVFKILKNVELVPEMVGMFQKEMADRIAAPHGSKTYGVISVLTQALYDAELLFDLPPISFDPPPKVNSSVIRLVRKKERPDVNYKNLRTVVKNGFGQRRKMLRNTMKPFVEDPEMFKHRFFTMRPEQLSLEEFIELTKMIFPEGE